MLPVVLLCGCRKYEEYLHAALKRMDRPEYELIGILGGGEVAAYDPTTKILTLPVPDTYEALPTKIHAAFAWTHANRPGIPGIFKTDDDMIFHMDSLVTNIRDNMTLPYWGVAYGFCRAGPVNEQRIQTRFVDKTLRPTHQMATYCFGWGYWVSKEAIPLVVAAEATYKNSFLEDVCTGYVLNIMGIKPVRIRFPYQEMERTPLLLRI